MTQSGQAAIGLVVTMTVVGSVPLAVGPEGRLRRRFGTFGRVFGGRRRGFGSHAVAVPVAMRPATVVGGRLRFGDGRRFTLVLDFLMARRPMKTKALREPIRSGLARRWSRPGLSWAPMRVAWSVPPRRASPSHSTVHRARTPAAPGPADANPRRRSRWNRNGRRSGPRRTQGKLRRRRPWHASPPCSRPWDCRSPPLPRRLLHAPAGRGSARAGGPASPGWLSEPQTRARQRP